MAPTRKCSVSIKDKMIAELESLPDAPFRLFDEFDDHCIRKYYALKDTRELARILNKTVDQVQSRAARLGVKRR